MSDCTHYTGRWVDKGYRDDEGDWQSDNQWVETSTDVDLDLHRYKCSQCGRIGYYSGAARSYYEDGVKSDIRGLDK